MFEILDLQLRIFCLAFTSSAFFLDRGPFFGLPIPRSSSGLWRGTRSCKNNDTTHHIPPTGPDPNSARSLVFSQPIAWRFLPLLGGAVSINFPLNHSVVQSAGVVSAAAGSNTQLYFDRRSSRQKRPPSLDPSLAPSKKHHESHSTPSYQSRKNGKRDKPSAQKRQLPWHSRTRHSALESRVSKCEPATPRWFAAAHRDLQPLGASLGALAGWEGSKVHCSFCEHAVDTHLLAHCRPQRRLGLTLEEFPVGPRVSHLAHLRRWGRRPPMRCLFPSRRHPPGFFPSGQSGPPGTRQPPRDYQLAGPKPLAAQGRSERR
jgi:hypothetical protein